MLPGCVSELTVFPMSSNELRLSHYAPGQRVNKKAIAMIFYVRNLSINTTEDELRALFEPLGVVASVTLLRHETTNRPLGVGVIEMPDAAGLLPVVNALVGIQIDGRDLNIGAPRSGPRRQDTERRGNARSDLDRRQTDRRLSA